MQSNQIEKLNGKREPLAPRLPLKEPLSISITTANICNLRCEFCAISEKGRLRNKPLLDMSTMELAVSSIKRAAWHLKQVVLVGLGEPLCNPHLPEMITLIKRENISEKVHVVTNAVLMTPQKSIELIEAGIDVLRISINGLSNQDYMRYTGVNVDFSKLIENISFFWKHKKADTKVYIKIMNYMVETPEREQTFREIFSGICDVINIEQLTEMSQSIDYNTIAQLNYSIGLKGYQAPPVSNICPLSMYHIYLNAEGTISACCVAGPWSTPPALVMGDLHSEDILEIWNGDKLRGFWKRMLLQGVAGADLVCSQCKAYKSYIYPEDVITPEDAEYIIKHL